MGEVEMLKKDKAALEQKRDELEKNIKAAAVVNNDATDASSKRNSIDANSAEQVKKVQELNEQIKTYKAELADKQKEFQHEKQELQKVIEEQRDQIKKGGDSSSPADVEALNKELQKAKQEVKEAAVERERFQSQLEMLVQELEQKQIDLHEANQRLAKGGQGSAVTSPGGP